MQAFLVLFQLIFVVSVTDTQEYRAKIAANNHLLVWYISDKVVPSKNLLKYQCTTQKDKLQSTVLNVTTHYSISIGKLQNESQLYFVVGGMMESIPYMSKISVNCDNNQIKLETVFFEKMIKVMQGEYFLVTVDPHGKFAVGCGRLSIFFYDLINLKYWSTNATWSPSNIFSVRALDISTHFLYVIGYSFEKTDDYEDYEDDKPRETIYFKASLYLMMISFDNSEYNISHICTWTSANYQSDADDRYFLSLSVNSINDKTKILIGIPSINTVHLFDVNYTKSICLQHISSKTNYQNTNRIGYGAGVAWLNQGQTIVVLDNDFKKNVPNWDSILHYYDIVKNEQITNDTTALSIFPNKEQVYPDKFNKYFTFIIASSSHLSTLYAYNTNEQVLIIPPSLPGYYSVNYQSIEDENAKENIFFFIPNSIQCPPDTYKNNIGVWPCSICNPIQTNFSIPQDQLNTNISFNCPQCINRTACPLEFLIDLDILSDIEQNNIYPELPEADVFDDIIIFQMFRTNSNLKSPFFILIIVLSVVLIIAIDKENWFGGLISIVLIFLAIFAAKFSHSYHYRYPIEKQICDDVTSCDFDNIYNVKFDSSLQLLSASTKQYEQIFTLLNSQEFTLNIELINTRIHCGYLTLKYEEDINFVPYSCYTNNLNCYFSVKLSIHNLNLKLILSSDHTIEVIRIGLSGPDNHLPNNYLQKLNFSKRFKQTNQFLSQNLIINLQLTKAINVTEGLTDNDNTTYTGLWLPTFTYDINQLFNRINSSENRKETILSLSINETPFFIKTTQKPIARRFEIIFHTILFLSVCIDLICMILLLLRIWFIPIINYFIRKLFHPNSIIYRLIHKNKSSLKSIVLIDKINIQENEIKKIQQQIETISKRIDTIMKLLNHSQPTTENIIDEKEISSF